MSDVAAVDVRDREPLWPLGDFYDLVASADLALLQHAEVEPWSVVGHQERPGILGRVSRLRVHPFDPLSAPGARFERIRKVLRFPCNLPAAELHDAHGVGRLTVICQDVFGDPKITAATDSPHSETLFTRLVSTCDLYVASTADSLA